MANYDPFRFNDNLHIKTEDASGSDPLRRLRSRGRAVRLWSSILMVFCVGFIAAHWLGILSAQTPRVSQLIITLIGIIALIWVGAIGRLGSAIAGGVWNEDSSLEGQSSDGEDSISENPTPSCTACGEPVEANANECPGCGIRLEAT